MHNTEQRRELLCRGRSPWQIIFVTVFPMKAHGVPARKASADGAVALGFRAVAWMIHGIRYDCVSSSWKL